MLASNSEVEETEVDKNLEAVTCYKCRMCGYLGVSRQDARDHLEVEHDVASAAAEAEANDNNSWMQVRQPTPSWQSLLP